MNQLSRCQPLLGTYVEITLRADLDDDSLIALSHCAFEQVISVEQRMSYHAVESELSVINRTAHQQVLPLSPPMAQVLEVAAQLHRESDGFFDVTVAPALVERDMLPDHGYATDQSASWQNVLLDKGCIRFNKPLAIDLGGIAKGFAVDCVFDWLDAHMEVPIDIVVNAGGDIRMSDWEGQAVNVRLPGNSNLAVDLVMSYPAVASSAAYFNDGQLAIVSPTGSPVDAGSSVTVFAGSCMVADALTKVVFLSDDPGPLLKSVNAKAVCIDKNGCVNYWG